MEVDGVTATRSRRHQVVSAFADCSIAGTAFYAITTYAIRIPREPAAVISALAAIAGILVLIPVILLGRFNPRGGSLVRASPLRLACVSVALGLFAVLTLQRGPVVGAYLPMAATVFTALLSISAAKEDDTSSNGARRQRA